MKWVTGFPSNTAGLPTIHATVILSDPLTGQPVAILDGAPITADRTAAISGVAIRHWGPTANRPPRVAILGAGVQARSHLPVIGHLLPGAELVIHDRHPERAEAVAVARATPGIGPGPDRPGRPRGNARRRRGHHGRLLRADPPDAARRTGARTRS